MQNNYNKMKEEIDATEINYDMYNELNANISKIKNYYEKMIKARKKYE